ncbi:hypothetical protein RRG08_006260 [Elysia crispata]|uniref:Uncharacterized protein n=1 Tax=Elysia crispata TaxID=231223 RepID=A0AAE0YPN1_9GAST|nr:hypothetical protein RRG08_006260 [Elysia crispata]
MSFGPLGRSFESFLRNSIVYKLHNHRQRCPPSPSRRCSILRTLPGTSRCILGLRLFGLGGQSLTFFRVDQHRGGPPEGEGRVPVASLEFPEALGLSVS